jgi:hypothetical protein
MWIVNAIMTVIGLIGLTRMGRETSTARNAGFAGVLQALGDMLRLPGRRRKVAA